MTDQTITLTTQREVVTDVHSAVPDCWYILSTTCFGYHFPVKVLLVLRAWMASFAELRIAMRMEYV
jgi:hypothetical protein